MATPNVVPRADQEGGLGTSAKSWGKLFIENPTDGGTAAVTISNLDVDKIALDINANNTTANIIDITSTTLAGGKVMHVDIDDAGTTSHNNVVLNLDIDKSGVIASGQTVTTSGFILDINDAATNNASGTGVLYGIKSTLTNANATGTIAQYGIQNTLSGGDTQWGIRNVCTGATAGTTTGFYQTVEDGGVDILLNSSADVGDYFSIATTTHGATTITTVDDDTAAADLTMDVDGDIILDSHTGTSASGGIKIKAAGTEIMNINAHHSGTYLQMYENGGASTDDYFTIDVAEHGDTTLMTYDNAAAAAHFRVVADGDIILDPAGVVQITDLNADEAKTISFGKSRHMVVAELELRDANATDHGVIKQLPGIKIPQFAHIETIQLTVLEVSNLGTYNIEVGLGTNDGVSAGTAPSDYHEILGAGVNYSYSTVSVSSNNDIVIGSSSGAAKKNWWNNRSPGLGFGNGELTADHYVYVCSSGTGNGTTDATAGKVSITIEYYGID